MPDTARMVKNMFVALLFLLLFDSSFAEMHDDSLEEFDGSDTAAISLLQTRLEIQKKHIALEKAHDTAADIVRVDDGTSFPTCTAECADSPGSTPPPLEKEVNTLTGMTPILLLLREVLLISLVCGIIYIVIEDYAFAERKKPSNLSCKGPQLRPKPRNVGAVSASKATGLNTSSRSFQSVAQRSEPVRLPPVPEVVEHTETPAESCAEPVVTTTGHTFVPCCPPGLELPEDVAAAVKPQPRLPPPSLPPTAFMSPPPGLAAPPGLDLPEEFKMQDTYFDHHAANFEHGMLRATEEAEKDVEVDAEVKDDELEVEAEAEAEAEEEEQMALEAEEDRQVDDEEVEDEVVPEPEAPSSRNEREIAVKPSSKIQKQKKPSTVQQKVPPKKTKQPAPKAQPKKQRRAPSSSETTKKSGFKWPLRCRTTLMMVTGIIVIVLGMIEVSVPEQDLAPTTWEDEDLEPEETRTVPEARAAPEVTTKSTGKSGKPKPVSLSKKDQSSISKRRKWAVAKLKKLSTRAKNLLELVNEDMDVDVPRIKKMRMNAKSLSFTMQDVADNEFPEQAQFDQVFAKWQKALDKAQAEVDSFETGSCADDEPFKA